MNKTSLLTVMILFFCVILSADITQYYTFAASTGTYTAIIGTVVPEANGDDVISNPINLGFSFVYGTNTYTDVKVSSNGYVTLGTAPGSTLGNALISPDFCPVLAPCWDDDGYATIEYLLTGTAPARIFTMQWTGMHWNYSSTTSFNMQVKIYESGIVEFRYDATGSTPTSASASIGINMLPGGVNNFISVTPGTPPTFSTTVENSLINTWPGANTIYSFFPIGGGVLQGAVLSDGSPLSGVTVTVNDTPFTQTTGVNGAYVFPFVQEGAHTVTFSKAGYSTVTLPVTITENQTSTLNATLIALPLVTITGSVFGSDAPTVGLSGAVVSLLGPINYSGTTNASGQFTITGVLTSTTFNYTIVKVGYATGTGTMIVGTTNYNAGNITLNETTLPPAAISAIQNPAHTVVNLTWMQPGTVGGEWIGWDSGQNNDSIGNGSAADFDIASRWPAADLSDFIGMSLRAVKFFPAQAATFSVRVWTGGDATAPGAMVVDLPVTNPTLGAWNTVILPSPVLITAGQELWFGVRVVATSGYPAGCDAGPQHELLGNMICWLGAWSSLTVLNPALTFDWNLEGYVGYSAPTRIASLPPIVFNSTRINSGTLRATGFANLHRQTTDNLSPFENDRALLGYKVWRLLQGNEANEATWTSLTPATITDTTFSDVGWGSVSNGQYKWAVKSVFTNNVLSVAGFSNMVLMLPYDLAAISIIGNRTPSVGIASIYTVTVSNPGTTAQAAGSYTVKVMSGTTELASVPGPAIAVNAMVQVQVSWTPATQGPIAITGKVVHPQDTVPTNNVSPPFNVTVQPAGTVVITIGEGDQTAQIPVNMFWMNSLFETVYQATELNFIGMITGLSFHNNFVTDLPQKPTKIWLGTTTQTDLAAGWIPSTQLTLVFDGNVDYPSGTNLITIAFPEPFLYLENNLVMLVQRPLDTTYFSSQDYFASQTWGATRSREVHQDGTAFDPENPPATTPTGQFPQTGFYIIPGGVGHMTGTVFGAGNQPLPNATVHILNGAQTTTNAQGYYMIHNIIDGDYSVTISRYGYYDVTQNVTIPEDDTLTVNFTLTQMPTVTVTGTVVGSDAPTVGLPGATFSMTGYENYQVTANGAGFFTIPGVYVNQTYESFASAQGYQNLTGTVIVSTTNHDVGNVVLNEIAYSPRHVNAVVATNEASVEVAWLAPDPNAVDVTQGFESIIFPPNDWSRIVTNTEPPDQYGVYTTWSRFGTATVGTDVIVPPEGDRQAGFRFSFNHQDEWLLTPQFNCPQGASLTFDSNVFLGSTYGDHYYVKASGDNGATWTVLWDASPLTGGWNHYATPIVITLDQFTGQQIKLAWHADDPPSNDGMGYDWFIDDVVVANNETTIRFPESQLFVASIGKTSAKLSSIDSLPVTRTIMGNLSDDMRTTLNRQNPDDYRHSSRSLVGYQVYRLPQGQEQNESVWTLLTPATQTTIGYTDTDWATVTPGTYKWAVKGVYTNNVLSLAMFSNPLVKASAQTGSLAGLVRDAQLLPIPGATVRIGALSVTSAANGSYILTVPAGTYTVVCSAATYDTVTVNNIVINVGQTTPQNFILQTTGAEDPVLVTTTALHSNYPNPFNPVTTLSFDVKDRAPVRIDIYNMKGQLVRTLVNEVKSNGHYTIVWNGKDQRGNAVASGIYSYRMQAGDYQSTRRMMLMK